MKKIALIGSTGSIGKQVLSVVSRNKDKFQIVSLSAGSSKDLFLEQVKEFKPQVASLAVELNGEDRALLPKGTEYFFGDNAFTNCIIDSADIVVVALVGFKGIIAVLDAINKNKNIALANKESLVAGGEIISKLIKDKGVQLTPIDSEHSAVWQALSFDFSAPFKKIILTASGGAFRDLDKEALSKVTVEEALKHPNWNMGAKITVDCATMVNKAYEVIEAKWLYNTSFDRIDVIIHRESIIHSMVEFFDNSVIAQLSYPNMEIPIALALSYPERIPSSSPSLEFSKLRSLTFEEVDNEKYPAFSLVTQAGREGGLYPAVALGANDYAVELFLKGKIKYCDIYQGIHGALSAYKGGKLTDYQSIENAYDFAKNYLKNKFGD